MKCIMKEILVLSAIFLVSFSCCKPKNNCLSLKYASSTTSVIATFVYLTLDNSPACSKISYMSSMRLCSDSLRRFSMSF
jgi:hypothetical protein